MDNSKMVELLEEEFPCISGIQTGGRWGADIFLGNCAEGGTIENVPACNYYGGYEDTQEKIWIMGVHKRLFNFLKKHGYHAECYDRGTYLAYKD